MRRTSQPLILSFRRTFALLILLVVLPSAGLSGFGIVAIINERAAVEKRLEVSFQGTLETLSDELPQLIQAGRIEQVDEGLRILSAQGQLLSTEPFRLEGQQVQAPAEELANALRTVLPAVHSIPSRPTLFSLMVGGRPALLVAERQGEVVRGARLSTPAVEGLLTERAGTWVMPGGEPVRFLLLSRQPEPGEGLVGKLVSEVAQARANALDPPVLAERLLDPPLQDFRLGVLPTGEDPVARASTRNRVVYGVLLALFYLTLTFGVVYTGRALYREARLSRLKTDFVSLVSHELRTPITSIRMFIETLALGRVKDPAQTQEVLQLLTRETERLSTLIEKVLDWARLEGGRKVYQRELLPVSSVVETAVAAFRAQRLEGDMQLTVDVPDSLPSVEVDRDALAGALLNLLQNAYKYSGQDKRIDLRVRPHGRWVDLSVEDHGMGIAPRDRKRIFERFYRVDNLLTRKTEGSGLGLAITKRIVEDHGGRITVHSTLGQGSRFTLHLPVGKA